MKRTLAKIAVLVAFALTSGKVKADQITKTNAQLAIEQFNDCANSLFKDEFELSEIDYELSLNKKSVLFLSAEWSSSDNTISIMARIRSIGSSAVKEMIITQNGRPNDELPLLSSLRGFQGERSQSLTMEDRRKACQSSIR